MVTYLRVVVTGLRYVTTATVFEYGYVVLVRGYCYSVLHVCGYARQGLWLRRLRNIVFMVTCFRFVVTYSVQRKGSGYDAFAI